MKEMKLGGNKQDGYTILYRRKVREIETGNIETFVLFSTSPFNGPSIQGFEIEDYDIEFLATSTLRNISKITFFPHYEIDDFQPLFELTDGWMESNREEFEKVLKNLGISNFQFEITMKNSEKKNYTPISADILEDRVTDALSKILENNPKLNNAVDKYILEHLDELCNEAVNNKK